MSEAKSRIQLRCEYVAVSRGGRVFPYPTDAPDASAFATRRGARLALARGQGRFSLSPATFRELQPGESVVLPSPNGAIAALAAGARVVLAGCLRNAPAVGAAVSRRGGRILVVPAGERWPDGSLRHCLEDWVGGAILRQLPGNASAEALAAVAAYRDLEAELLQALRSSISGRELIERGYADDIEIAAEACLSAAVPIYDGEVAFTDENSVTPWIRDQPE